MLKLAMAVRGTSKHYRIAEIQRRHFNATARASGLAADMEAIIADVLGNTDSVIDSVGAALPDTFPPALFDAITKGLRGAARQLTRMSPT